MMVSKRKLLFQGLLFRFHVKFQGCRRLLACFGRSIFPYSTSLLHYISGVELKFHDDICRIFEDNKILWKKKTFTNFLVSSRQFSWHSLSRKKTSSNYLKKNLIGMTTATPVCPKHVMGFIFQCFNFFWELQHPSHFLLTNSSLNFSEFP